MKCTRCGYENPSAVRFCGDCGAQLESRCLACQASNPPGNKFCHECGAPLTVGLSAAKFGSPQAYTPKHLAEKILTSQSALEGERKQVTVLFVDVSGFTSITEQRDPEDIHRLMTSAFELMLAEVHRYEGTVNQFLGDGIMALFGAPIAHEDHARRAVHAALGIRKAMESYQEDLQRRGGISFRVRQGLNSGLVVVGSIGSDLRMDYTAIGDTTNVAARLLQAADPGRILISEATHRFVEGYFYTRPLSALSLRGRAEPVRAWEVVSARVARTRLEVEAERGLTPFVGREHELRILFESFEKVRAGHGQVVFLAGEPGIGKSRLLLEFRRRLGEEATWLEGHCLSFGRAIAFHPLIDMLKRNFQIEEEDSERAIVSKIERAVLRLGEDLRPILPYLRYLLSVDPGDPSILTMEPKQRRGEVFNALRRLSFRAVEVRPQLFVFEDIHWMDKTTEEYLAFFVDSIPTARALLILNYRLGYAHPLGERIYHTWIALDTLSTEDSVRMAHAMLTAERLPEELKALIVRNAEGNPFFVEEIVKSLRDAGAIQPVGTDYVLVKPLEEIFLPGTVQDLIMARIDRLEEAPKRILQTAAVIGRQFSLRLLCQTLHGSEEIQRHLDQLKRLEFIYEKRVLPETEYAFRHSVTQEVAYESLLLHRRRELHGVIGRAMEELYSDRLEEHYALLAHHYLKADDAMKATEYLVKAGDRAVRLYANAEARAHYTQAFAQIEKEPESARRAEWWIDIVVRLCWVSGASGEFNRDLENLAAALRLAERIGDRRRQSQVLYWIGRTYYVLGRFAFGIEHAEQALAIADELGDDSLAAMPLNLLGRSYFAISEFKKAWPVFERNAVQFERLGNSVEAAPMYAGVGCSLAMLGQFDRALPAVDRALAIAKESGHLPTEAACYQYRVCAWLAQGHWPRAIEDIRQALELAERVGDPFRRCMATGFLGGLLVMTGEYDPGVELLEQTFHAAEQLGTKIYASLFRVFRAEAHLARQETDEAVSQCRQAIGLAIETNDRWSEAWARRILGEALYQAGPPNFSEAERELVEAIRIQQNLEILPEVARSLLAYGRLLRVKGERGPAQETIARATAMFKEMGMGWDLARAEA